MPLQARLIDLSLRRLLTISCAKWKNLGSDLSGLGESKLLFIAGFMHRAVGMSQQTIQQCIYVGIRTARCCHSRRSNCHLQKSVMKRNTK